MSIVNIILIIKYKNVSFNDLYLMDIFICIYETCHSFGGRKTKRDIIPNNKIPFSEKCLCTLEFFVIRSVIVNYIRTFRRNVMLKILKDVLLDLKWNHQHQNSNTIISNYASYLLF